MSTEDLLPCVEIEPAGGQPATHAVIWLHGLGADGHDFEPIVPHLGLPPDLAVRFVFPHAPAIPVTLNAGFVMPAWYDIRDTDLRNRHDEDGVRISATRVEALMAREYERGIVSENLILAGFSQGGAIALHVGLRHERSRWQASWRCRPTSSALTRSRPSAATRTGACRSSRRTAARIRWCRCSAGEDAKERLEDLGYSVEWRDYPMQHAVCPEEIADIGAWLSQRLV